MKKILFVHGSALNRAGTENFMMNVIRYAPKDLRIDLLVFSKKKGSYEEAFIEKGTNIYHLAPSSFFKVLAMLKKERYDLVHAHMNALNGIILPVFKLMGVKVLVSHSHGSKNFVDNYFLDKLENVIKKLIPLWTDHLLACSKEAGAFLYGKHPYRLIDNGIDLDRFYYDAQTRARKRQELGLDDMLLVGAIGRLNFQKNPLFLLDVLAVLKKSITKVKLVYIGEGELKEAIIQKAAELKIGSDVLLLGSRNDVPELLNALDFVLMPSLFEGLPYALVEAQASGVYCLCSTNVDQRTKLTANFTFLKIDDPKSWADVIKENSIYDRQDETSSLKRQGFDAKDNVMKLCGYYIECLNKKGSK